MRAAPGLFVQRPATSLAATRRRLGARSKRPSARSYWAHAQALGPESAQICEAIWLCSLRRGALGRAAAAVEAPGRGQDLVGAAGARGRVDGAEVAARLAHHDRLRDRPVAEPAGDRLLRLRPRETCCACLRPAAPSSATWDWRLDSAAACCGASLLELRRLRLGVGADAGDLVAGGGDPLVERDRLRPEPRLTWASSRRHLVAELAHAGGERRVGVLDPAEELGAVGKVVEAPRVEQQRRSRPARRPCRSTRGGPTARRAARRRWARALASWAWVCWTRASSSASRCCPCARTAESCASRAAAAAACGVGGGNLRGLGVDLGAEALRLRLGGGDLGVQLARRSGRPSWPPDRVSAMPAASSARPARRTRRRRASARAAARRVCVVFDPSFTACGVS